MMVGCCVQGSADEESQAGGGRDESQVPSMAGRGRSGWPGHFAAVMLDRWWSWRFEPEPGSPLAAPH